MHSKCKRSSISLIDNHTPSMQCMQSQKSKNKQYRTFDEDGKLQLPSSESGVCSDAGEQEETESTACCHNYTKLQCKIFASLIFLSITDVLSFSVIAPFFPVVAQEKGISSSLIGVIFASFSIFGIVGAVFVGSMLTRIGAKFCVLSGMFLMAGALICFGFVETVPFLPFVILSVAARGIVGFGSNMAFTAMFAIVFQEFQHKAITALSLSEALVGVGGMIGPVIGGLLYDAGGFIAPFLFLGAAQFVLLIMCWFVLPDVPCVKPARTKSPFHLLKHSSAVVATLIVVIIYTINSFLIATLSTFLHDQFKLNATVIGTVFLVFSVFYGGMSPLWGWMTDRWKNHYLLEFGLIGMMVGMATIGPASVIRHALRWRNQRLWLVFGSAALLGATSGSSLMPTFGEMIVAASELRVMEDELAQYGLVAGLWNVAFSVGDIAGPALGGALVERFGFPDACGLFAIVSFAVLIVKIWHRCHRRRKRALRTVVANDDETDAESRPLLSNA